MDSAATSRGDADPAATGTMATPPVFSVIVPTFNECDNIEPMYEALEAALAGIAHEIVFVDDDSTDGTRTRIAAIAARDPRVRMLHRIGRRGLATAVTEGMLSTSTPYLAVIDADLQHDERILPKMFELLRDDAADLVVGSRYVPGGSVDGWDAGRARVSAVATRLAKLITRADISDPMSGFFAITRDAFESSVRDLSGQGYKILLDICASAGTPLRTVEVAYSFRTREAGESKLDALITWEYLLLLVDKLVGHIVPARFLSFIFIGGVGVLVHMSVLSGMVIAGYPQFIWAQGIATAIAMIFNFFVNNTLTYRDRRLKGAGPILKGLLSFVAVCSVGAVANVGIANYLFADYQYVWWTAGMAGILVGAVWNYAATSIVTWRVK